MVSRVPNSLSSGGCGRKEGGRLGDSSWVEGTASETDYFALGHGGLIRERCQAVLLNRKPL